ncbi:MAG: glycosyltransferase [Streptococcaceae bacterium]|nr:glycosyltransferase [Streptococcaceae bacterium]
MTYIHTFVICAYQESIYLEECIQSCLTQESVATGQSGVILYTSTPNEYIINLCEKYHIEQFVGSSSGIGANWNEALSFVKTDLATIAHQDDIYLPDYGTEVINAFKADEQLNIAFTDYLENDAADTVRTRNINLKIKSFGLKLMSLSNNKRYQRRIYAFGNFICCPAVTYNLQRLADFKFDENLKMALDWDAWERIMKLSGRLKFIPDKLMYHRIHPDSETTFNTTDQNREKEEYAMFRRYWPKLIAKLLINLYIHNQKTNS